ncbi:hypothetical protein F5Y04DRAFT_280571 [Hypomontagnella monticulosa]|nr:hypothetical protein F5Y04DRAFT_280571 [Hypomontagnella monticulosa]
MSHYIHTTEDEYEDHIPWYERRNLPSHELFDAFSDTILTPPPQFASGIAPREQEQCDEGDVFRRRQAEISHMPSPPTTPPPKREGLREPPLSSRLWGRSAEKMEVVRRRVEEAKGEVMEARERLGERYKRKLFEWERWYWLNLTAYQQSAWPETLRVVRKAVMWLLVLAFIGCVGWLTYWGLQGREIEREQQQIVHMNGPTYDAWIRDEKQSKEIESRDLRKSRGGWAEVLYGA